jgi:hypothetical protein
LQKVSLWSARRLAARYDDDSMNRENVNPYQPIVDLNACAAREIMDNAANVAIDCCRAGRCGKLAEKIIGLVVWVGYWQCSFTVYSAR